MKILQLPNPGNGGRLGNMCFGIASTIGLALRHGYTPRFPADWKYRDVFNIPDEWFGDMESNSCDVKEWKYEYDYTIPVALEKSIIYNISLSGYFQSPKYWEGYEKEIRQYLTPKGCNPGSRDAVGIHYRRGDYVGNPNYVQLGDDYYKNAFYGLTNSEYTIARSDDAKFVKYTWGQICGTEIEDFISLAVCKEHIISNSTYSWWAAYLSGGKVVAPKEWFAGELAKRCSTKDLLPENWILI
jgi:hypothetical protein